MLATMSKWSAAFMWVARAEAHDAERERYLAARAVAIMDRGIARAENRVLQLDRLNKLLMEQLEQGALWLEDMKAIGTGDKQQVYQLLRYNSALVRDVLATLDDAAKETGGREQKIDLQVTGLAGALSSVPTFGAAVPAQDAVYVDVTPDAGSTDDAPDQT